MTPAKNVDEAAQRARLNAWQATCDLELAQRRAEYEAQKPIRVEEEPLPSPAPVATISRVAPPRPAAPVARPPVKAVHEGDYFLLFVWLGIAFVIFTLTGGWN